MVELEVAVNLVDFFDRPCKYGAVDDLLHMSKCLKKIGQECKGEVVDMAYCEDNRPTNKYCYEDDSEEEEGDGDDMDDDEDDMDDDDEEDGEEGDEDE